MARIRSAKPDFWSDPLMCSLQRDVRFTYKGLWEVCADDHGRFLADARVIKGAVWPMDDDIKLGKIEQWLQLLAEKDRIQLYIVHGVRYGFIRKWLDHQRVSHPKDSRHPAPPTDDFPKPSGGLPETIATDSVQSGADRIREELNRSGAEEIGRVAVREDLDEDPPPPRVVLPRKAEEFLSMFYPALGDRQRDRYLNVKRQLYDALDPKHPGVKIRGGARAHARSPQHFEECAAAVMKDPPMDRDMAIVFLLKKLTDPPKGPSAAEVAAERQQAVSRREEQYHTAMRQAGVVWAKEHPDDYERIRAEVDAQFRESSGSLIGKMARESALAQRCGRAAGFPDFATWDQGAAA